MCRDATPVPHVIEIVKKAYAQEFVVIYTARQDDLIYETIKWLKRHDVPFHAISNIKMPADLYLDDKSINPNPQSVGELEKICQTDLLVP